MVRSGPLWTLVPCVILEQTLTVVLYAIGFIFHDESFTRVQH